MTPEERAAVGAGLDKVSELLELVPETAPHRGLFVGIAKEALNLAQGLVNAGHTDPAAELLRLRGTIEKSWQEALDKKFGR